MAVANSSNISTIQILRSYANTAPSTLLDGQLAYSFVSNTLYIGSNTGIQIIGDPSIAVKSQAAYNQANTATVLANAAYAQANVTIGVDATQNTRLTVIEATDVSQNARMTIIEATDVSQNNRLTIIENTNLTQNTNIAATDGKMSSAYNQANTGTVLAQASYNQSNASFLGVNTAIAIIQGVDLTQNTNIANKLNLTGSLNQTVAGNVTISQDLVVSGNLILTGNINTQNVQQFAVADPLILLGIGNYLSDTKDIGFAAHYNNGTNAHTGIIRDSGTKEYYVFQGYVPEVDANNNVIITDPTFSTANLNANYFKGNLIGTTASVNGLDISSVWTTQNSRMTIIEGTNASQNVRLDYSNTAITIIQGTDTSQNARMTIIEGTDVSQNARMTIIEGVDTTQNTNIQLAWNAANGAFALANTEALSSGWTANAVLYANNAGYIANSGMRWDNVQNQLILGATGATGNLAIGTTSSLAPITVSKVYSTPTGAEQFGTWLNTQYTAADGSLKQGLRLNTYSSNTSGTMNSVIGLLNLASHNAVGGTTTNLYGHWSRNDVVSGGYVNYSINYQVIDGGGTGLANNQYGFYAANLTKGSNANYGFFGAVNPGANTAYNLYMQGTAPNYLAGSLTVANNVPSTSSTTGTVIVTGGVGVSGNVYVGNTTSYGQSFQPYAGSSAFAGLYNNSVTPGALNYTLVHNGSQTFLNGSTGVYTAIGGATQTTLTNGIFTVNPTTASTSNTTGALIVAGGLGVSGNTYLSGNVVVSNTSTNLNTLQYSQGSYTQESYFGITNSSTFAALRFNIIPNTGGAGYYFNTYGSPAAAGWPQFLINHTSSAVNYLQVSGNTTGNGPVLSAQGSDANTDINLVTKGTGSVRFNMNTGSLTSSYDPAGNQTSVVGTGNMNWAASAGGAHRFFTRGLSAQQFQITDTASTVNYVNITGSGTGNSAIISAAGTDNNISMLMQPKGNGAFNISTANGVNLSSGNTSVTAITRTVQGSLYTSVPSLAISAPTTASGVQATAIANLGVTAVAIAGGGTGYTAGDTLTVVGGTGTAAQLTVGTVSSGVITAISVAVQNGIYSVFPTSPVSVTGGTGSGATFNISGGILSVFTITNPGSGYVEQPTVSFSGGGGSGATAYASVGSGTILRTLASPLSIYTLGGEAFRVSDSGATSAAYWNVFAGSATPILRGIGSSSAVVETGSAVPIQFRTNGTSSGVEQLRVAHTASAVNYVQVTGAATGGTPTISSQGNDGSIPFNIVSKGTGGVNTFTGSFRQFRVDGTNSAVNYLQVAGSVTGFATILSAQGSDTNIDINLVTKGTGNTKFQSANGTQLVIADAGAGQNAVNYHVFSGSNTSNSVIYSAQGTDANVSLTFLPKGTGAFNISTANGVNLSSGNTTVTGLSISNNGSNYTSFPTLTISPPTTLGGITATGSVANMNFSAGAPTVVNGGTGYSLNDVLTIVGGTPVSSAGTLTVTGISANVITSVTYTAYNTYSVLPSNPVSVTGGTGTSATFNLLWKPNFLSITNPGSGYVEQPTVSFSGGSGSGVTAYASVGSSTLIKSLSSSMSFYTPGGEFLRLQENNNGTFFQPLQIIRDNSSNVTKLSGVGQNLRLEATNSGGVITLGGISGDTSLRVSPLSSAVNYVNITGNTAGGPVVISSQGSDTNIGINIIPKGNGSANIVSTANSTSNTTGALVVTGGMGITGNVFLSSANNFFSTTTGASYRLGWPDNHFYRDERYGGINFSGGYLNMASTFITSAALSIRGTVVNDAGNNVVVFAGSSPVLLQNTTPSTSNITGALVVAGGVGVKGNVATDGIIFADGTRQITAGSSIANTVYLQGVNDSQNARMVIIEGTNSSQNVRLDYSNTAITIIQGVDVGQNNRMTIIEGVDVTQNTNIANKLNLTGSLNQTVSGNVTISQDLIVSGNLIITGNIASQNVQQLAVADPLIILGIGNYVSDTKDIGFAGHYNDGTNAHAGLIRDSGTKEFYVFQGYTPELDSNNNVIITDPTFTTANLNANYVKSNLVATTVVVNGIDLSTYTQATYAQANVTIGVDTSQNARMTIIEATDVSQNSRMTIIEGTNASQNVRLDYSNTAITIIQGVDVTQNTRLTVIEGTDVSQNARMTIIEGTDTAQNTRMTVIEGTDASQNVRLDYSNTAITIIQGVDVAQNTSISATDGKMQSAYNTANNAVANIGPVITTNTTAQVVIANTLVSTSNTTGALLVQGGVGVKGNVATDGIIFADGTRQTTAGGSGGGSSSGYLANSMIIANSTGYLSNTANLLYFAANDTTYHSGSITVGQSVIANNFIKSSYPTVTPTGIVNKGNGTLSNNTITAIGFIPQSMSVDPNGGFLYAVGRFSVSVLSISPATGALVNTGSFPISTSYNTPSMIDPSGRYLYVAADAANMVIQFTINQTTGALTNTSTIATGVSPKGLYVEPAGRFLYTFNTGSVTHFTINQSNGNLTNTSTISAFSGTRFAIDPTGRFLYTTGNGFVNNITQFTINQSNGVLSNTNTVLAGTGAHSIGIEPSGKFLYVTNYNDGTIGQYKIDAFTGILSTIGTVTSSPYPQQLTIDPNGNFLYIIDQGYQVLGTYSINKSTGNLTSISSVVVSPTFSTTWSLTSDPTGRFVYSSNPSGSITQYLINNANFGQANVISLVFPDGTRQITAASGGATVSGYLANSVIIANSTGYLSNTANLLYFAANDTTYHSGTIITGQTIASNTFVKSYYPVVTPTTVINRGSGVISNTTSVVSTQDPFAIKIDPTGRFVYDLNYWNNTVSQFIINQNTGQLTNNSTTLVGTNPYCLAIHPSGNFVYVGNSSTNDISHCTINQANGALTLTSSATGLSAIRDLTVDPTGRFLYAVEYNLGTLYSFTINQSTGTLTLQNTITNGFGSNNTRVVVEPTGRYLYLVLNGTNKIYIYSINQSTGVPTGFYSSSTSYPTISGAFDIVIEPAGRYAYVSSKLGIVTQCLITANGYFNNIATISTNSYTPLAMDSTGRFLYTSNNINGLITQYKINQLTGELTNNSTLPITTSTAINNFALDPKDRFLYGTNFNNNFIVPFLINNFNAGAANVVSLNAGTTISTDGVFLNSNTITSNIVIPVGYNGFAVGPITIANNVTLTVSSNSRWLLL